MALKTYALTVATAAPVDEVQSITPDCTTFTLTYAGQTTDSLTLASADGAAVTTALEALSNLAPGDVVVTGSAGGPYEATFGGTLAGTNVAALTGTGTGGAATVTVATTTPGTPRTSPQLLVGQGISPNSGARLHIRNTGGAAIYVGGSDVTSSTGISVAATSGALDLVLADSEMVYAVTADGGSSAVRTLLTGD